MSQDAERAVIGRLQELLRTPGDRSLIAIVVRPLPGTAMVQVAAGTASADALRAAAAELQRLAAEQERETPKQAAPGYWWVDL